MQMQTSGKCQRPEHECQDSIASLRIGRESSHPSHAASVHACSKKLYHTSRMAWAHRGLAGVTILRSATANRCCSFYSQISIDTYIDHSQTL